ncbi:zinc finger and SCAN domain-containing protein 5A [Etheostoma spectabile]|uniref:zinc finger and SCAN domain-containing protein 5A n=1 Tax=Etheostoma spectabile TaxID=54343 RepID=UPI0013AECAC6|nr:zinc finger and SCAN domain-containing protein 5A-like [Etheostoma spectabile]
MEVLVKAAVTEISKLVDDKCAFLHLEISRKQSENEMLKRKLLMMENKNAQLQRGFENYMDRGTDEGSCPPTGDIKFPDIDDATYPFTIKEESSDEMLWISDPAGPIGSAVHYRTGNAPESQQFEDGPLNRSEVATRKSSEFSDLYNSGQHAGDIDGPQITIKTEKEEDRSRFNQDGCQHGAGKHIQLAADFSVDERENQLWSSIIEGNDIDAGFPDFSSVVEEYSNTFPDNSDVHVVSNAASLPACSSCPLRGRAMGSTASSGWPAAAGQAEGASVLAEKPSHVGHARQPDEHAEREGAAGDKPAVSHSHNTLTTGSFKALSGPSRGYSCSLCGKTFGRLHQFKLHQQSHKRKRAFWCTVCGKSFQFVPPQHTPPDAHGREALRLRAMRKAFHAAEQPEGPPAHAQRGAALQLLAVREKLHPDAPSETPQNHSHLQLRGRDFYGTVAQSAEGFP